MGMNAINWMAKQKTGDDKSKSALFWLAFHMNDKTGECFPSISTLQAEMEVKSDNTVRSALRRLRDAGLISWERETRDGVTVKTKYRLHMHGSMTAGTSADKGTSTIAVPQPLKGGASTVEGGASTVEGGTSTIAGGVLQPVRTNMEIEQGINRERNRESSMRTSGAPQPPEMSDDEIADLLDSVPQGKGSPFPEKGSPISSAPKHRTTTPRKKPATRCPFGPDASIPPEYLEIAQKAGIGDPQQVFSAFVNHAIAHDRSLVVWPAGFRTWCSNELRYHPNQTPKPKPLHQRTAADYDW